MLLLSLVACGTPAWGTWMFTREITLATGEECTPVLSHNFIGAYEPITAGEDTAWTEFDEGEVSAEVFFGRLEQSEDGAVLILGTEALPGARQEDGTWLFYWTGSSSGSDGNSHATGYVYDHAFKNTSKLLIAGTLSGGAFTGTHETVTESIDTWTEFDVWSAEAAAYVGDTGAIPSGTYLSRIDAAGAEVAATNAREAYDCGESGCTLSVTTACAYRYVLTGVATDFDPADSRWVEDAGQPAGE